MNIDKLINLYYDKINDFKKDKKEKQKLEKSKPKKERITLDRIIALILSTFLIGFFILFSIYIFIYEFKNSLITAGFMIFDGILMSLWDNRRERRYRRIDCKTETIDERIKCLIDIFNEEKISLSSDNIERIIQAGNENKPKHSNVHIFKKFIHIMTSGIAYYIPILVAILFCDAFFGDIDLDLDTAVRFIFMLTFYYLSYLFIFSVGYCVYISEIDPHIRKMYHFHDTFISDLRQLNCFRDYYGLDKTEEANPSEESDSSNSNEEAASLSEYISKQTDTHNEVITKKPKKSKKKKEKKKK